MRLSVAVAAAAASAACLLLAGRHAAGGRADAAGERPAAGIHKIEHVVVIMQENRSFDHYFGTFPGADGIPMRDGQPVPCVPNPAVGG